MSSQRVTDAVEARVGATAASLSDRSPVAAPTIAGLLAVVPVAGALSYRVWNNVPGSVPAPVAGVVAPALPFLAAGPALAALVLAATTDRPAERVGLAFLGGFGLVALASRGAWYPAATGVALGGVLAVGSAAVESARVGAARDRYPVVGAVVVAAVLTSLAATAGVAPPTLRPLGSALALLGIALAPALVGTDRTCLAAGALAGAFAFAGATQLPFVAGAVLLVGGGVVGAPVALVVLAVGGGVAAVVAAVRRGDARRACGAGLLLAAAVPGTLLQALGALVALALLAGDDGGERP